MEGDPFVLYDSEDAERIIILSNPKMLKLLAEAKNFASDGTFKIAPHKFYQVYVVRAELERPDRTWWVTVAYVLLKRKTRRTYVRLFQKLTDLCQDYGYQRPNPEFWIVDFELPAIKALQQLFPNCDVKGCLYHLRSINIAYVI